MSKIEWRVDAGTHIVLRSPLFQRRQVEMNGQPVDGEWRSKRLDFALADGRPAYVALKAESLSGQTELVVDGKLIPDARFVPKDLRCPACNAEIQLLDEFCTKCGHALGNPSRFTHYQSVKGATTAIYVLAALYAIFGVVMFYVLRDETQGALDSLATYPDDEILMLNDGSTARVSELRTRVLWEHRGMLVVNFILAALMLVLAWWSKRKPLAAILIATAIFAALLVVNAIIDPRTLMQGIFVKVLIVAVLAKGIKGALDMRTANG